MANQARIKPILFSTEMVRAILDGRKTVTRRAVKDPYYIDDEQASRVSGLAMHKGTNITHGMPYEDQIFSQGDILWVRETWGDYREHSEDGEGAYFLYRADYPDEATTYQHPDGPTCDLPKWHPSIHMPREAARIWLRVTDVRVERLQDCGNAQAKDEGCTCCSQFARIWDSNIKPADCERYGWEANPWVWVVDFERAQRPKNG